MPVNFQDYYKTLGIKKSASQEDIQRAYRKLARKYHPDINKASGAEDSFKQINEAYEVLGDPEKRKKYDQVGSSWNSGFETYNTPGSGNVHFNFSTADPGQFSDFFQNLFGGGWGLGGESELRGGGVRRRRGRDHESRVDISLAEAYYGVHKNIELERIETGPDGRAVKTRKSYGVAIPRGVTEGSLVRLSGQGGSGSGGGEAGDLYLSIHILPDLRFTVNEHDLSTTIDVAPWEAALGSKVTINTMDGRINLSIPAGTQSGRTLRVRGKGMPDSSGSYGDLLVSVRIVVPTDLSARERQLFEALARESGFKARK
ncbi:MAG: J domain-containing protein [Geobacteraceae bacterium]|nr:J domain-containing protein [Geobacteraceae bacterium]NTW78847.1 J domain-containing protein [Geobacteraceae bacterium]